MALRDALEVPERPPNLRAGTARARCGLCRHFDGRATCRLFNYPVKPNSVSDAFSSATERAQEVY